MFNRKGMPDEIDVGYYTVWQPISGVNQQVAEIVSSNNAQTETWFLYTAGNVYQWPSSRNTSQQMTFNYAGTKTVAEVQTALNQSGQAYQKITLNVAQQARAPRAAATAKKRAKAATSKVAQTARRAAGKVKAAVKKATKKVSTRAKGASKKKR